MDKVEDLTHSYALAPLSDQYMVHVEEIDGKYVNQSCIYFW